MSIVRSLLNNGFFILLLAVVAIIYIAYSDSIKKDHGLVKSDQLVTDQLMPDEHDAKETDESNIVVTLKEERQVVSESINLKQQQEEVLEVETVTNIPPEKTIPEVEVEEKVVEEVVVKLVLEENLDQDSNEKLKAIASSDAETPLNNDKIDAEKVLSEYKSFSEAIAAARKAVSDKNLLKAEEIYYSLAEKVPSEEVFGEFGNVLYHSGKQGEAEGFWFKAGKLLIKKGKIKETIKFANRLEAVSKVTQKKLLKEVEVVRQEKQEKAEKLKTENDNKIDEYYSVIKNEDQRKAKKYQEMLEQQRKRVEVYNMEVKEYYEKLNAYNRAIQEKFNLTQLQGKQ